MEMELHNLPAHSEKFKMNQNGNTILSEKMCDRLRIQTFIGMGLHFHSLNILFLFVNG